MSQLSNDNQVKSIAFTQLDDEISALLLWPDFIGFEFIYDEMEDRITEVFLVNAVGTRPVHTPISLSEAPQLLLIKVKQIILINYGIK